MLITDVDKLRVMDERIAATEGWWRFPTELPVQGFLGTGIFIVGDQPSTSEWGPLNRNRRAFYDLLPRVGLANAHLTDLYKRRGKSGSLREGVPDDFQQHVELFRAELALLKPTRVIALGNLSYQLLSRHVPEVRPMLAKMWHFAHVARYNKVALYSANVTLALGEQPIAVACGTS